jgi:hypothetical protein
MSDDEGRHNVSLPSYSNWMVLISFSLKARPGPQQRYLAKDIFGSDSDLSDAPDAEGEQFHHCQFHMCHDSCM